MFTERVTATGTCRTVSQLLVDPQLFSLLATSVGGKGSAARRAKIGVKGLFPAVGLS